MNSQLITNFNQHVSILYFCSISSWLVCDFVIKYFLLFVLFFCVYYICWFVVLLFCLILYCFVCYSCFVCFCLIKFSPHLFVIIFVLVTCNPSFGVCMWTNLTDSAKKTVQLDGLVANYKNQTGSYEFVELPCLVHCPSC